MPERPVVAVAGATGAVGREMLKVLEQRGVPRLAGRRARVVALRGQDACRSRRRARRRGDDRRRASRASTSRCSRRARAISKQFREAVTGGGLRDDRQLLGVPHGRGRAARGARGEPERRRVALRRHRQPELLDHPDGRRAQAARRPRADRSASSSSTYQAASGAGQAAMDELYDQTRRLPRGPRARAATRSRTASRSTASRRSTSSSTTAPPKRSGRWSSRRRRSCTLPDLAVAATCVRVPVLRCHSEAVNVEFSAPVTLEAARAALAAAPGVTLMDDPAAKRYPMPAMLEGTDDTYVGRLRADRERARTACRSGSSPTSCARAPRSTRSR